MSSDHDAWRQRVLGFDSLRSSELEPVLAHLALCPECRAMREEQLAARREGRPYPPPADAPKAPEPTAEAPAPAEREVAAVPAPAPLANATEPTEPAKASLPSRRERSRNSDREAPAAAKESALELTKPFEPPVADAPVAARVAPPPAATSTASAPPSAAPEAPRPAETFAAPSTSGAFARVPHVDDTAAARAAAAAPAPVPRAADTPHRRRVDAPPASPAPASAAPIPRMKTRPAPPRPHRSRSGDAGEWDPLRRLVFFVAVPVAAVIALIAWVRHAAGPPPPPPETATTSGFAPAAAGTASRPVAPTPAFGALDLQLERYSGASASDGGWHSGDAFELRFSLPSSAHVVVWRVRPSGDVMRVHPPLGAAAATRHGTGEIVLPPLTSRETWSFDDVTGPETFLVAVSEATPPSLESLDQAVTTSLAGVTDRVARLELLDTVLRERFGPASRLDVEHLP